MTRTERNKSLKRAIEFANKNSTTHWVSLKVIENKPLNGSFEGYFDYSLNSNIYEK